MEEREREQEAMRCVKGDSRVGLLMRRQCCSDVPSTAVAPRTERKGESGEKPSILA